MFEIKTHVIVLKLISIPTLTIKIFYTPSTINHAKNIIRQNVCGSHLIYFFAEKEKKK